MQWLTSLNRLANAVTDSLWQSNCPLCKRPAEYILCKDCDRQIAACQSPEFLQKDYPLSSAIPLYSWGIYDGALKRAIATCKYDNHPEIMEAIAEKIADTWKRSPNTKEFIQQHKKISVIPIPLHVNKLKSRGFNQAEILARRFCELTALHFDPQSLQRVKDTKAQMQTKSIKEREQNLSRAFSVPLPHRCSQTNPRPVILLDDIHTTGATIHEAITTLANSNLIVRAVIVLSRPQFKS